MTQFVEAVADAATGEFERLKEFGIKANSQGNQVSFTFQGVTKTIGKNKDEIVAYLQEIGATNFAGSMEEQMKRLPGVWSNLKDNVDSVWRAIGDSGVTDGAVAAISSISAEVGNLADMIQSGYLGELLSIQFRQWIDAGAELIDYLRLMVSLIDESVYTPLVEMITGKEIDPQSNTFIEWAKFIGQAFLDLPTNLKAAVGIIAGELDLFTITAQEKFDNFLLAAEQTWLNVGRFGEEAMQLMQLGVALGVDAIINEFANMIGGISSALEAMPDALIPESWVNGIEKAEDAIRGFANGEAEVRAEMEKSAKAHEAELAAIQQRQAAGKQLYDTRRDQAKGAIASALEERDATLSKRDADLALAEANYELARSTTVTKEEHDALANALMNTTENSEQATAASGKLAKELEKEAKAAEKAGKKAEDAAKRKLSSVTKSVQTEREKVKQWYDESVAALEDAEKRKLGSSTDYAELRRRVDEEYAERNQEINDGMLKEQFSQWGKYGDDLYSLYGDFSEGWKNLSDGNTLAAISNFEQLYDSAGGSFDNILDNWEEMLKQMAIKWAVSGLADLVFGTNSGGINWGALVSSATGSNGGGSVDWGSVLGGGSSVAGASGTVGGGAATTGGINASAGATGGFSQTSTGSFTTLSGDIGISSGAGGTAGGTTATYGGTVASGGAGASTAAAGTAYTEAGVIGAESVSTSGASSAGAASWAVPLAAAAVFYTVLDSMQGGRTPQAIARDQANELRGGNIYTDEKESGFVQSIDYDGGGNLKEIGNTRTLSTGFLDREEGIETFSGGREGFFEGVGYQQLGAMAAERGLEVIDYGNGIKVAAHNQEELNQLMEDYDEQVSRSKISSEEFHGLLQSGAITSGQTLTNNLTRVLGGTIETSKAALVEADKLFDGYVASGTDAHEAVYQSLSTVLGLSIDETKAFVDASGLSAREFAAFFKAGSGEALGEIERFRDGGLEALNDFNGALDSVDLGTARGTIVIAEEEHRVRSSTRSTPLEHKDTGKRELHSDGPIYAHKGEMIIDPKSADVLRRYGINMNGNIANAGTASNSVADSSTVPLMNKIDKMVSKVDEFIDRIISSDRDYLLHEAQVAV